MLWLARLGQDPNSRRSSLLFDLSSEADFYHSFALFHSLFKLCLKAKCDADLLVLDQPIDCNHFKLQLTCEQTSKMLTNLLSCYIFCQYSSGQWRESGIWIKVRWTCHPGPYETLENLSPLMHHNNPHCWSQKKERETLTLRSCQLHA